MAKLTPVVLDNEKPNYEGDFNVKIRIGHKSKNAYLETGLYVGKRDIGKDKKIKTPWIIEHATDTLKKFNSHLAQLRENIEDLTAGEIKQKLIDFENKKYQSESDDIDFLNFCKLFIEKKEASSKASSARTLKTVYNSLVDYFKSTSTPISSINYSFLIKYEAHLTSERTLIRNNHGDREVRSVKKGVSEAGLHNHMRDLRLLFNEARNYYNDEDLAIIRIPHYPFKKYKVGTAPLTEHRDRPIDEIIKIRDAEVEPGSRAELARDLCMLSFYLLGMNAADLYELPERTGERIKYNRAKTRAKRKDNALISIKVVPEAKPLLKKYAGQLQKRYVSANGLNKAIDEGLKILSRITGVPDIDFYDIRHCVGTWARNICGYSKDDVASALNQNERTVTDTYIAPDWSTIDRVQASLIQLIPKYGPYIKGSYRR